MGIFKILMAMKQTYDIVLEGNYGKNKHQLQ